MAPSRNHCILGNIRRVALISCHTAAMENITVGAGRDPCRRALDCIPLPVRMAGRVPDLAVAEQLRDHRRGLAERQRPRGKGMTAVMDTDIGEPRRR